MLKACFIVLSMLIRIPPCHRSGETSSGKTELRRLTLRALINLSAAAPGKKGSKLAQQIPAGEFILECLGNARTMENSNASRFGKYTELQFSNSGKLVGSKTLDYYLERNRVVSAGTSDGTFHIFYAIVAGASKEEKEHLKIGDGSEFRYLGGNRHRAAQREDADRFARLKHAFKAINLSQRHVASICQVISAILHLGNLEFVQQTSNTQDPASIRNHDVQATVANFLGINAFQLEEALVYKTKLIRGEVCTIVLDADGAATNRDELAKAIYALLFAWVNENINEKFCKDDFETFVGILDLPGPATSARHNSLDQFCVNFANERLHRWVLESVFQKQKQEFGDEGIDRLSPDIPFFDNADCIRLLTNQPGGLVHIMDDQARRMPKKTDHSMVEAFGKRWGNHPNFKAGATERTGFASFTVSHFHGPVSYSSEHWLERNAEIVNPDFVSLLRGSAEGNAEGEPGPPQAQPGSSLPFVRNLFKTAALRTQTHPRNDKTVVAAQQSVKPMRAPSVRKPARGLSLRRGGTLRKPGNDANSVHGEDDDSEPEAAAGDDSGKIPSPSVSIQGVAGELRGALDTLFGTLEDTKAWTVACLRPNDNHLPNQFEARAVKQQIRTLCLTEMTRKLLYEYSVSMTHEEFCERYAELPSLAAVSMAGATGGSAKQKFASAREVMSWSDREAANGQMKVFLAHEAFRELEDELRAADPEEQQWNARKAQLDAEAAARGDMDPYSPFAPLSLRIDASPMVVAGSPDVGYTYGDGFREVSKQTTPLGGDSPPGIDESKSMVSEWTVNRLPRDMEGSVIGTEAYAPSRNMFDGARGLGEKTSSAYGLAAANSVNGHVAEEIGESSQRRTWLRLVWLFTFFVPSFLITSIGKRKRPDVRMAWREKLAINMMIWFVCGCAVFVIAVLGNIICPKEHVYTINEISDYNTDSNAYTYIRGEVFDLTNLLKLHRSAVSVISDDVILDYAGEDSTSLFPVQVNALCNGVNGAISPWVQLTSTNTTDGNAQYHDFRSFLQTDVRPDWYYESMWIMRSNYRKGFVGYDSDAVDDLLAEGRTIAQYNGGLYDVTDYVKQGNQGVIQAPDGSQAPADTDAAFMSDAVIDLFTGNPGGDITTALDTLNLDATTLAAQKVCLRNLFYIGKPDHRNSPQCLFSKYILLALSIFMVSIIGFKFIAALQFGRTRKPGDYDKFVICQVPCYTEGEESMRKTIDSLAALKYDDKRKLLFVICDGMIVGAGNDRPTPRIVLDILGADPNLDPEPLSFLSVGEGSKQHNMGKIYSGLYEYNGHVVPYIVVVKVGKPTERQRPGNRGKRDSQLVLMRFLNKVHFGSPMNPLELEIYHQIKNIIGVNPSFYEYLLQVDADTTVDSLSLGHFLSAFINDKKIIGLCGETALSNAKKSFITMLQVYEYYISHYLAKAFESLFGSVTCLPGCFSMFRLRTPDTHRPLFVADRVVEDYAENRIDTLHTKNLLSLGEDRYLTTVVLKHFGNYKTVFVRAGKALTAAPEDWNVLISQRRRWINSTVHNLCELMKTPGLCGFCLFSMRFIVFIDLLSTIVAPVTVAYIVYLVVLVTTSDQTVPVTSLIMIAAIYGLQAIIFILNRKFEMIGWMLIYLFGIPLYSFLLPLYSFWRMDDFSWGNTRVVTGEKGQKVVLHDEGKFDPAEIPLQTWEDYENELWERNSGQTIGDILQYQQRRQSKSQSQYGINSMYEPSLYDSKPMIPRSASFAPSIGRNSMMGGAYSQYPDPRASTYSLHGMQQQQGYTTPGSTYGSSQDQLQQQPSYLIPSSPSAQNMVNIQSQEGYSRQHSMYGMPSAGSFGYGQVSSPVMSPTDSSFGNLLGVDLPRSPTKSGGLERRSAGEVSTVATTNSGISRGEGPLPSMPSDDTITADLRQLLAGADLSTVTKKQLRGQLSERYGGVDLRSKKDLINRTIDEAI